MIRVNDPIQIGTMWVSSIKDNATKLQKNNLFVKRGFIKGDRIKHIFHKLFYNHELQKNGEINIQEIWLCDNLVNLFPKIVTIKYIKKIKIQHWNTKIERSINENIEEKIIIFTWGGIILIYMYYTHFFFFIQVLSF